MAKKKITKKKISNETWAVISIVLGGIVIAFPQIISIAIGIYLIVTGIIGLVNKK